MKIVLVLAVLASGAIVFGAGEAQARCPREATTRGYCPQGTCNQDGGTYACYLKNCSAKNCRK